MPSRASVTVARRFAAMETQIRRFFPCTAGEGVNRTAMARRIHIIFNPAAGWRRRARLERVLQRLDALGAAVTLRETRARGDAESIARGLDAAACDAVVAAGGDGTINEVLNGLGGRAPPLGIVPLGTANVLAAEIGLPRDPGAVADIIAFGRPAPIYCGSANGRRFAMMVGIGFDARVVEGIDLRLKRLFGKAAYVASALAALARHAASQYRVEIDGAAHSAAAVVIAKGHYYGGRFVVAAQARLDEPLLHVALFGGGGARRRAALCPRARRQPHRGPRRRAHPAGARSPRRRARGRGGADRRRCGDGPAARRDRGAAADRAAAVGQAPSGQS